MRDGVTLSATVLLPPTPGRYPVVLVQTPYGKDRLSRASEDAPSEAARGSSYAWSRFDRDHYAYVVVDWRGFHGSAGSGSGRAGRRGPDGYDAVEWAAAQPWSDGRVGTWGGSALGKQQLDTAAERPPHLVCAVPMIAFMGQRYEGYYEGGVPLEGHTATLDARGFGVGGLVKAHPFPQDPVWALARRASYRPERIDVPCLLVSGWWDHFPREVIETFEDVVARGGDAARSESRLVMGPWSHTAIDVGEQGDLSFPAAEGYSTALTRRFFDRFLRGIAEGWDAVPRVHWFQAGEERWVTGPSVASLLGTPRTLHLRGDGILAVQPAAAAPGPRAARTYRYDPRDPPRTPGGRNMRPLPHGPRDVAALIARADAVRWTTEPLEAPLAIRGEARARLLVACDRPDVDVCAWLCDTEPDGRTVLVGETARRASHRSERPPAAVRVGEPFVLDLRWPPHAYTWGVGHRLTLLVASGNWPRYERNPHTGAPAWEEASARDVTVTLLVGPGDATLDLPVVAR
jgi:hypothetical protein